MRGALVFIWLLLCTCTLHAQNLFTALRIKENNEYYSGRPVRIIKTDSIHFFTEGFFSRKDHLRIIKNVKYFDANGMIILEENYNEEGKLDLKIRYTNNAGKQLRIKKIVRKMAGNRLFQGSISLQL